MHFDENRILIESRCSDLRRNCTGNAAGSSVACVMTFALQRPLPPPLYGNVNLRPQLSLWRGGGCMPSSLGRTQYKDEMKQRQREGLAMDFRVKYSMHAGKTACRRGIGFDPVWLDGLCEEDMWMHGTSKEKRESLWLQETRRTLPDDFEYMPCHILCFLVARKSRFQAIVQSVFV